jgi:hypothetical protein
MCGELSQSDRRSFELRFLASPDGGAKWSSPGPCHDYVGVKDPGAAAAERPFFMRAFWGWNPVVQFAAGMAV